MREPRKLQISSLNIMKKKEIVLKASLMLERRLSLEQIISTRSQRWEVIWVVVEALAPCSLLLLEVELVENKSEVEAVLQIGLLQVACVKTVAMPTTSVKLQSRVSLSTPPVLTLNSNNQLKTVTMNWQARA